MTRPTLMALFLTLAMSVAWTAAPALADGEVQVRGAYYKEDATRVVQPMLDIDMAATESVDVDMHMLVDSITSASVSAGADGLPFTENRVELGGGTDIRVGEHRIGAFGRYSDEPDYKSYFGGVRSMSELADKNTTLSLTLGGGRDRITNEGAQGGLTMAPRIDEDMTAVMGSVSLGQLLSPTVIAGATYDLMYGSGFLANAYRPVSGGGDTIPVERVPDSRVRHALFASVRGFVPRTGSTWVASYRLYVDSWDIVGHTPEVRLVQAIAAELQLHLRYRFHRQGAAFFYKPIYQTLDATVEPYVTEDAKLSAFHSHTLGFEADAPLSLLGLSGRLGAVRADILVHYVIQRNRFGNAVILQAGVSIPFGD